MALRNIVERDGADSETLHKKCRPVDEVNDRIRVMLDDMVETMRQAGGVGLAAPQVGILRRIFVAEPEPDEVYYFVNPEIVKTEGSQESQEGCLSVPGYIGIVDRPERITIRGLDRDGNPQEFEFEGFPATVMCHEYDHLDGILYTEKARNVHLVTEEEETEGQR